MRIKRSIKFLTIALMLSLGVAGLPSPAQAQTERVMQNAATANGNGALLATAGQSTATITVKCVSCSGGTQVNFEGTNNQAGDYVAILGTLSGTTTTATSTTSSTTQVWVFSVASYLNIRARISAYSAGTVTVEGRATPQGGGGGGGGGGGSVTITDGIDTAAVTAGGDLQVSCSNCSGTGASKADDAAFGIATDSVAPAGFLFDDVASDSVNEGDVGLGRMSGNRIQYQIIRDGAGNERGANVNASNQLEVNSAISFINTTPASAGNGASGNGVLRVTIANDSTGILAGITSIAQLGGVALPVEDGGETPNGVGIYAMTVRRDTAASSADTTGDNATLNTSSNGGLWVQNVFQTAADAAEDAAVATNPIPIGGVYRTASVTLDNGDVGYPRIDVDAFLQINGSVAHDGADSGNPLKIGYKATTSISGLTMVANADRTDAFAGIDGVQVVRLYSNLEDRVSATPVGVTDGSSTQLVAAQGAGIRFCATDITVSNSSATNVTVDIRDGTGGAVLWTFPAAANMGGATHHFGQPLCTTANTAMAVDPSASATTVTTSVLGFKTKL